jgi:hypothetical protein
VSSRFRLTVLGWVITLLACCLLGSDRTPTRAWAPEPVDAASGHGAGDDHLSDLDAASQAIYRDTKERAVTGGGPVILVVGDELVMVYGRSRTVARFTPAFYHDLKSISHVPSALYCLAAYRPSGVWDNAIMYELRQYRNRVAAARRLIGGRMLSDAQVGRQEAILSLSLEFIDGILAKGCADKQSVTAFADRVQPLRKGNTVEAIRAQLDTLHRQVGAWRATLTQKEWERLTVIMTAPQLPRKDNLAVDYFSRLLGEAREGKRVVYAEALFVKAVALDLLATRQVGGRIGEVFFNDPNRMYADLLGDAAKAYLNKLFEAADQ